MNIYVAHLNIHVDQLLSVMSRHARCSLRIHMFSCRLVFSENYKLYYSCRIKVITCRKCFLSSHMLNFVRSAARKYINNIDCSVQHESCYFDTFR
jgi:hypothetical protein